MYLFFYIYILNNNKKETIYCVVWLNIFRFSLVKELSTGKVIKSYYLWGEKCMQHFIVIYKFIIVWKFKGVLYKRFYKFITINLEKKFSNIHTETL